MKLGFTKIREVKNPERGTKDSAGLDFFVPKFTNKFVNDFNNIEQNNKLNIEIYEDEKYIQLYPQERVLIPTGIKLDVQKGDNDQNYAAQFINKSGVGSKYGLDLLACLIDSDFTDEVLINLVNTGDEVVFIKENQKIVQMIVYLLPKVQLIEYQTEDELYENKQSEREGGFGSTGD